MSLCGVPLNLTICRGKTFTKILRWGAGPQVYKAITSVPSIAPMRLGVVGHGLVNGWSFAVAGVVGMVEINAKNPQKLNAKDFYRGTVLDPDTLEINKLNGSNFSTYVSGGVIQYSTPTDLSAFVDAEMQIRDPQTDALLATLSLGNSKIVLDNVLKRIILTIPYAETAAYVWDNGIYDLELSTATEVVGLVSGKVKVSDEVTK